MELAGTVVDIDAVFYLNAGKVLHCAHVPNSKGVTSRVILITFTSIHVSALHEWCLHELRTLDFPVPTNVAVHQASHGSVLEEPGRLRQLTLSEAFTCPEELLDRHDVVEIIEISEDNVEPAV